MRVWNGGINIKKLLAIMCLVILSSLAFASMPGVAVAQKAGYEIEDFEATTEPTIDGTWSNSYEWTDAAEAHLETLNDDATAIFRIKHDTELITGDIIYYYLLIEDINDTTNDAGDLLQICLVGADEVGGTPTGSIYPQENCFRFDYLGHNSDGFKLYRGTGTGWSTVTNYNWPTDILIVDSFSTSPLSDTPHLIIEVRIAAAAFNINPEYWLRVVTYDETNAMSGIQMWPTGSREDSNDWGQVDVINETIPEFPAWTILPIFATVTLAVTLWKKRLATSGTKRES